ncbi:MAG: ABC transporter permease subunit [Candidatus Acidiferrales bacterium]
MNPMIRKELFQRMRERKGWILPSLYLLVLAAVVCLVYHLDTAMGSAEPQGSTIGVSVFVASTFTQLGVLLLLAPIFGAGSIAIEKEQHTLGGLLTSMLSPAQIWWGKFVSSLLYNLLLLVTALPILSVAFAFGGIGLWELSIMALTTVIILATITAVSLFWSSAFRRSVHATAVSYVTVIVLSAVTLIIFFVAYSISGKPEWLLLPAYVKAPLYANPGFFMLMAFASPRNLYPHWVVCLLVFLTIGGASVFFAIRNLRRSGNVV